MQQWSNATTAASPDGSQAAEVDDRARQRARACGASACRTHRILAIATPVLLWLGARSGLPFDRPDVLFVGLLSWPIFVWGALAHTKHVRIQTLGVLIPIYAIALVSLGTIGLSPGGVAALSTFVVLTGIFFGRRLAWCALGLLFVTLGLAGFAFSEGWFPLPDPKLLDVLSRAVWIRMTTTVVVLAVVATSGVTTLISRFDRSVAGKERAIQDLKAEQERRFNDAQEAIVARDEFLMLASHELRTPITPLLMKAQNLERRARSGGLTGDPDLLVKQLHQISEQVAVVARVVDELLDVSHIIAGRLSIVREEVDLVRVLGDVVARLSDSNTRAGSALTQIVPAECIGRWDRSRLGQVIVNLLDNAIKYGQGRPIDAEIVATADMATLAIRDRGIGVEHAAQERIFERFERAVSSAHYGGLGLGLWTAKRIVDALGGRIRIESKVGEGTTFVVELPRGESRGTTASPHPPAATA
jgi:signal transduction histidine kinase